ncbi:MAG TPA: PH domain-containing protein [Thermoanaerobaculia bacterium]|jgi:putative membrane protein|nr:PH domain-containing protein [Thermoanaerobaculia bacterium]
MPSERRLHPASILFGVGAQVRSFAIPVVLVLIAGSAGWGTWQIWALPFVIPYIIVTITRYISFRYRYEVNELVIRSGLIFRNERHIPYSRIQNLDAVQNVFHRLLGVVEVRVETGGGQEPEAKMSVLPVADLEEMRQRVFAGRQGEPEQAEVAAAPAPGRTLLHLSPRELLLCGFIENRGFVLVAAAFGLVWEAGLMEGFIEGLFGEQLGEVGRQLGERKSGRGLTRLVLAALLGRGGFPLGRILVTLAAFVGLLIVIRLVSMLWALVRLHGFTIRRDGEDLRSEFGLLTRVAATIPLRRIQTLTIREGPLHRLFRRAAVRAETAGGHGGEGDGESGKKQREWLAPILPREALPGFLHEVLPELDWAAVKWNPAHPRAFRRELKQWIVAAAGLSLPFVVMLKWWDLALLAALLAWGALCARFQVANLGWAVTEGTVLFRSGWVWRQVSVARFAKIQAVTLHESPFDRRAAMARVRVDTAGAGATAHRVDIPYLARDTARELLALLSLQAGRTAFRW